LSKSKFPRGKRGGEYDQRSGKTPEEIEDEIVRIVDGEEDAIYRDGIMASLLWDHPEWAKFLVRNKVPLGLMFKPHELDKISASDPLSKRRSDLEKASVDVSHLRFATLGKITAMKKRLQKKGHFIVSSSGTGYINAKHADEETMAKSIYDILNWNFGRVEEWNNYVKLFGEKTDNKALNRRLRSFSRFSLNHKDLPNLTQEFKELAYGVEYEEEQ